MLSITWRMATRTAIHTSRRCSEAPWVFKILGSLAPHGGERAVEGAGDVGNRNGLRLTVEPVAAFGAALAGDNARLSQLAQDPLEELQRDSLGGSDDLPLDELLGIDLVGDRQLQKSTHSVVGLR